MALEKFIDRGAIADWAKDAAAQTLTAGIVQGMTDTTHNGTSTNGSILLSSGVKLTKEYIERLRRFGVTNISNPTDSP